MSLNEGLVAASALIGSVKGELNTKLTAPETAGTSGQVLVSDGEGGQVWGDIEAGEVIVDSTLSVSGAAADAKAAGDEIAGVKSAINSIANAQVPLNKSDIANVYISGKTIGNAIAFKSSTASVTAKKIIPVKKYANYKIVIHNSSTPESTTSRDSVITDANNIVRQTFAYTAEASGTNTISLTSVTDGYLYISLDKNYVSVEIYGGALFDEIGYSKSYFNRISESLEAENLFDITKVTSGKIHRNNGNVTSDSNTYASDYVPVKPNTKYILKPQYSSATYGIAYYNSNYEYISGASQSTYQNTYNVPLIIITPENAAYIRFSIWHTTLSTAGLYLYSDAAIKKTFNSYDIEGEELKITPKASLSRIFEYSEATYGTPQGGAIYNGKLFIFGDDLESNCMFDLEDYTVRAVTYVGDAVENHANVVTFGKVFYDEEDPFPVVYISSGYALFCGIYRIQVSDGDYSFSEISRINYPSGAGFSYADLALDTETDSMYLRCVINDERKLIKYALPDDISENITLELEPVSEEHPNGYENIITYEFKPNGTGSLATSGQDSFITNNKFYLVIGSASTACLNVYDLSTGKLKTFADLVDRVHDEPEVCALYDGGIVIVSASCKGYYMKGF